MPGHPANRRRPVCRQARQECHPLVQSALLLQEDQLSREQLSRRPDSASTAAPTPEVSVGAATSSSTIPQGRSHHVADSPVPIVALTVVMNEFSGGRALVPARPEAN